MDLSTNISELERCGVVVIGRNEEARLGDCLSSVASQSAKVVYVDSGSSDRSCDIAEKNNVPVVHLIEADGFSAARARNAGVKSLVKHYPDIKYVQFIDGDCILESRWLPLAVEALDSSQPVQLVCGRRRERFPELSHYNQLCDIEWNTPIGDAKSCGGDFCVSYNAFESVGGFNPTLIAGEEPELCVRLRKAGHKISRLDVDMTLHDADMRQFRQWWSRSVRSGYAFAEGAVLHPSEPGFRWWDTCARVWFWSCLSLLSILFGAFIDASFFAILLLYPVQIARIFFREKLSVSSPLLYAVFMMIAKFAELQGQITYWYRRMFKASKSIIEYK